MSQALEQFQQTLVYEHSAPAEILLEDLARLQELDKEQEGRTKKFGCFGLLLIPIAFVGTAMSAMVHPAAGVVVLLLTGGGSIYLLVQAYRSHKRDVEDRRYHLLRAIIDLISKDTAADGLIAVRMSLQPPTRRENFVEEGKTGPWNFKLYHDGWLELSVKLLDGTACRLLLTDRRQQRYRWKTSASGKSKYKTKTKSALEVSLRLKPKSRKYQKLSDIGADAEGAVQLPPWAGLKSITVEEGGLAIKTLTKTDWDAPAPGEQGKGPHGVHLVAMSMLSLYQILNLSKTITKSQGDAT